MAATTAAAQPGKPCRAEAGQPKSLPISATARSRSSLSCPEALPPSPPCHPRPGQTRKETGSGHPGCAASVYPGVRNAAGPGSPGCCRQRRIAFLGLCGTPGMRFSPPASTNPAQGLSAFSNTSSRLADPTSAGILRRHEKTPGSLRSRGQKGKRTPPPPSNPPLSPGCRRKATQRDAAVRLPER